MRKTHGIAALAAAVLLSACQSNGMAPQTPSGLPQNVSQATTSAQTQSKVELYSVTELPTLGGDAGSGYGINNRGWIVGIAATPSDAATHAVLFTGSRITDLGTLGGPNSYAFWNANDSGIVVGFADTSVLQPGAWCVGDGYACLPFYWYAGTLHALPTLGGNNGEAVTANSSGEIVGVSETGSNEPNCTQPQVAAVRWDSRTHQATPLPNIPGDVISHAFGINDSGDVVGWSGPNPSCEPFSGLLSAHAVLWPRNAPPIILPTLGGTHSNYAVAINNRGDIVGVADLPDDSASHAVLWKKGAYNHVIDLGTLPGYVWSVPSTLNNKGQVVGYALDAVGNPEGFLWENGSMYDLTTLLPPGSNLDVIVGGGINNAGVIAGEVCDTTGYCPPVRMTPTGRMGMPQLRKNFAFPERISRRIMRNALGLLGLGR